MTKVWLTALVALLGVAFAQEISPGDTAWILTASALVLLMTPGLAFFYGGLARGKAVLNTMLMSFIAIGIVGVLWVVIGYSLAFGEGGNAFVGGLSAVGLNGLVDDVSGTIPTLAFVAFQAMFAIITPALISGAIVDRMKFSSYVVFIMLWSVLIYAPLAHWVWSPDGWLLNLGALDFAGERSFTCRRAFRRSSQRGCWGRGWRAVAATRCHTTFLLSSWAQDSSGSAGSGSTPVLRSLRTKQPH